MIQCKINVFQCDLASDLRLHSTCSKASSTACSSAVDFIVEICRIRTCWHCIQWRSNVQAVARNQWSFAMNCHSQLSGWFQAIAGNAGQFHGGSTVQTERPDNQEAVYLRTISGHQHLNNIWTTFEKLCVMALNPARTPLPFIDLDSSWRALSYCCTQCELHRPIWRRALQFAPWCTGATLKLSPKLGLPTQQVTLECKRWFDNLILIILISKYMISIYWYIWLPHRDILHSPILASILAHSSRKSLLSLFVRFSVPSAKTQCFL